MAEVEQQAVVEAQEGPYTSGGVIPTLADLTYIEKSVTPPAE